MTNLTIVIPVYNVKEYLTECLNSLPSKMSIILVNDGSTDGSDIICKKYASTNPNVTLINKPNGGLSDARNAAYPFIDTDYVFFLDSDDYINADYLLRAFQFASSNNLDWVQCGYVYNYDDYILKPDHFRNPCQIQKKEAIIQIIKDSYIRNFAWGKIYKSSIVKNFLFPKGKFYEDVLWQYRVIENSNSIGIFPYTVTYYRQRMGSISAQFSIRLLDLLDGLMDRLNAIEFEYPELCDMAAFNLWKISHYYMLLAKSSNDQSIVKPFETFYISLLMKYSKHIKNGINSENLFNRIYHSMDFNGWIHYRGFCDLIYRLVNRFSTSNYTKIIKNA